MQLPEAYQSHLRLPETYQSRLDFAKESEERQVSRDFRVENYFINAQWLQDLIKHHETRTKFEYDENKLSHPEIAHQIESNLALNSTVVAHMLNLFEGSIVDIHQITEEQKDRIGRTIYTTLLGKNPNGKVSFVPNPFAMTLNIYDADDFIKFERDLDINISGFFNWSTTTRTISRIL